MTPILADAGEITLRDVAFIVGLFATCASVAAVIARPIYGRARKVDEGIEAAKRVEAAVFPSNDLSLPERVREISQRQQELGTHFDKLEVKLIAHMQEESASNAAMAAQLETMFALLRADNTPTPRPRRKVTE